MFFVTAFSKLYFVVYVSSVYHPSKVNPSFVGAVVGSATFSPSLTVTGAIVFPPLVSKVTVYLFSVHFA